MPTVIAVSFRRGGKRYYFDPGDKQHARGEHVIAETTHGVEFGTVVEPNFEIADESVPAPLRPVLRAATREDEDREQSNRVRESEAMKMCTERIRAHGLPMRPVDAAYTFDRRRVIVYFTSEHRVDFRGLVRDLARDLKTRVELHQLGVRDQARAIGGYGMCGRELCCSSWMPDFVPTAIRMAKEQGLSLNPTKVSGLCGRLLCCLRFEYETYIDLRKDAPRIGAIVQTERGPARVRDVSLLAGTAQVEYEPGASEWRPCCELGFGGRGPHPCRATAAEADLDNEEAPASEEWPAEEVAAEPDEAAPVVAAERDSQIASQPRRGRRGSRRRRVAGGGASQGAPTPTASPAAAAPAVDASAPAAPGAPGSRSSRRPRRRRRGGASSPSAGTEGS